MTHQNKFYQPILFCEGERWRKADNGEAHPSLKLLPSLNLPQTSQMINGGVIIHPETLSIFALCNFT